MDFNFKNVFITGASRGLGLEFIKQLVKIGGVENIWATYRDSSKSSELVNIAKGNSKVKLVELDVKDHTRYNEIANQIKQQAGTQGINLLINNAGIYHKSSFDELTSHELMETFEINVVAPLLLTREFIPLLKTSASTGSKTVVANISSFMGSISQNDSDEGFSYRSSKAALNQVTKGLSNRLKKEDNIIVISYHPGWVQTDMGGPNAMISASQSVEGLLKQISNADLDQGGLLINYEGNIIPY